MSWMESWTGRLTILVLQGYYGLWRSLVNTGTIDNVKIPWKFYITFKFFENFIYMMVLLSVRVLSPLRWDIRGTEQSGKGERGVWSFGEH